MSGGGHELGPDIATMRQWLYGQMDLSPEMALLDAGCGDGHDLRQLGERVGAGARLLGIDRAASVIERAQAAVGDDRRFVFSVADLVEPWPFDDASFDLVSSNNVLECLTDKQAFLRETNRVLKPGGQVVCAHWDHDTQTIDGADKVLVRRIVAAFSDWQQAWMPDADGWMGRRLWRTFQESGLFRGEVRPYVLTNTEFAAPCYGYEQISRALPGLVRRGLIEQSEYDRFYGDLCELARRGEYFYSSTLFVYVGRKAHG